MSQNEEASDGFFWHELDARESGQFFCSYSDAMANVSRHMVLLQVIFGLFISEFGMATPRHGRHITGSQIKQATPVAQVCCAILTLAVPFSAYSSVLLHFREHLCTIPGSHLSLTLGKVFMSLRGLHVSLAKRHGMEWVD